MTQTESDQILEDLCFSNGINLNEMKNNPQKATADIRYLECFFIGFQEIMHIDKFPHLTELKIIAQELKRINGLENCVNLTELWLAECQITKINGLKNCRNLKKLYLYSNSIDRIDNLESLNLEVLWLSNNKITKIEGLDHMSNLVNLNLAKNQISQIGTSLSNLKNLRYLNLSANFIENLEELIYLQSLPSLKNLLLKDPQYGQNPVTILCNYSLFVMYHLPGLINLDTIVISQRAYQEIAESTINKKKLWYFMQMNILNRELFELNERFSLVSQKDCSRHLDEIYSYASKIRDISKKVEDMNNAKMDEDSEKLSNSLKEKIKDLETRIKSNQFECNQAYETRRREVLVRKKFILTELENCGNIKLETSLTNSELWYKSCHDLIMSRFCATDYAKRSINSIRIIKIIKITNRALLAKFEESLLNEVDESDYLNNKVSLRKKMEYLFYRWSPCMGSQLEELFQIVQNGFQAPAAYKSKSYEEAVPFTNSLSVSDYLRCNAKSGQQNFKYDSELKFGYSLLCKVYVHNFSTNENLLLMNNNLTNNLGVKRQFRGDVSNRSSLDGKPCDCNQKQMEWFLFNKHLAVPEYIVHYEYLSKNSFETEYEKEYKNFESSMRTKASSLLKQNQIDSSLRESKSANKTKTEETVKSYIEGRLRGLEEASFDKIVHLNLHNTGLTDLDIEPLKMLRHVSKLVLSFNQLSSLKDCNLLKNVEHLDASYNFISSLDEFKDAPKLNYFDLSNNKMDHVIILVNTLKNFPLLSYLDLRNNPLKNLDKYKILLSYLLKSLTRLNKETLNKDLVAENKLKINTEMITSNGYVIPAKPRFLNFSFVTDIFAKTDTDDLITKSIKHIIVNRCLNETDALRSSTDFLSKITVLNLCNQNILRLTNLEGLVNLKWASFNNNLITKIEGLDKCKKLEELSLENNLLQSLDGLDGCESLRKLNVNHNEIYYAEESSRNWALSSNRLVHLAIANNRISSFKFVTKLPNLIELYASFNKIKSIREVFHLKQLSSLLILDLWSNPMCVDPKYRLFLIYNLKSLKSLDGFLIESSELSEARETFGGKLTCDFIAEKFPNVKLNEIKNLEFPQCSLRLVDLGPTPTIVAEQFENLRTLNLESNSLTSFSGLIYLKSLKVLCLNYNKIESIFPKSKSNANANNALSDTPILPNLEVLHLAFNSISDLNTLQIGKLTSLRALFLQGNDITKIEGLEGLRDLRELVLDKNKIKCIGENSFNDQSQRLAELHIEENRLRDLSNVDNLKALQKLYVANNKITEFAEIEPITELPNLQEISMINNPISRRSNYRYSIIYRVRRLKILDLMEVIDEDRIRAEIYFAEQQQMMQQPQMYYNGMMQQAPPQPSQLMSNMNQNPASLNTVNINQLDHPQFFSLNQQSPRLKPINFQQQFNNQFNTGIKKNKNNKK